jgi:hypothetical protein
MVDSKLTMLLDLMDRMFRVHPRDSVIMNMVMMNLVDIKEEEVIIEYHQEHQGMFSINYCLFAHRRKRIICTRKNREGVGVIKPLRHHTTAGGCLE